VVPSIPDKGCLPYRAFTPWSVKTVAMMDTALFLFSVVDDILPAPLLMKGGKNNYSKKFWRKYINDT
jgi:hypothetical protein